MNCEIKNCTRPSQVYCTDTHQYVCWEHTFIDEED